MTKPTESNSDYLDQAKASLQQLREKLDLSDNELKRLGENKLKHLDEMIEKIENGIVEIAVFGEVSSGKSSLLNAMLGYKAFEVGARNGVTIIPDKRIWESLSAGEEIESYKNSKVVLVDSPGINEIEGKERAKIAYDTIRTSDIILFIVKGDLTETEHEALKEIYYSNKPIIVAINKVDIYTKKERKDILDSIRLKLDGLVNTENIVETAGEPKPVTVIIQRSDGSEEFQERKVKPHINELRKRIVSLLPEWQKIVALNSTLFAANLDDESMAIKIAYRNKLADMVTLKYSMLSGTAAALNPIPIADMAMTASMNYLMVKEVADIYSTNMSFHDNQALIRNIAYSNFLKVGGAELATFIASTMAKLITTGLSQIVFAIPQGLVAGWTSYIIGKSTDVYFSQGSAWGEGGAKKVVQDIIDNTDKASIISELKIGILEMLQDEEGLRRKLEKAKKEACEANSESDLSYFDEIGKILGSLGKSAKSIFPF